MKKEILISFILTGLLLITPLVGVAKENKISNSIPEMPDDVEGLVAQMRTVVDEVLQRYGHIPMVRSLCNMIIKLDWFPGFIVYLIIFYIIQFIVFILYKFGPRLQE